MTPDATPRRRLGAEERSASILAAAREAFARSSYADVALPDIARAAGASPGLVFHYFGSKAGLYTTLVTESLGDLARARAEADAALGAATSARDRVRTWVLVLLDHVSAQPRAWASHAGGEEPPDATAARAEAHEASVAFLQEVLQPDEAARDRFAIHGFLGFLDRCCRAWADAGCPEDDRHPLVDAALGALEGALGDWRR